MELLLDQGLPRTTVGELAARGIAAAHVGDLGMSGAKDAEIPDYAGDHGRVVVSLDSDFHALLALAGATGPSVVRIRVEGLKGGALAELLERVLATCENELEQGAVASVTETSIRIRSLPIGKKPK